MSAFGGKADEIIGKADIRYSALIRQNSDCDYDGVPLEAGDMPSALLLSNAGINVRQLRPPPIYLPANGFRRDLARPIGGQGPKMCQPLPMPPAAGAGRYITYSITFFIYKGPSLSAKTLKSMVSPSGFEPETY